MEEKLISSQEFLSIARELELYHAIFSKIWSIGKPRFTEKIPTACVTFSREGNFLDFQFNPIFWDKLSLYEKLFVIGHECLHIILNHGTRMLSLVPEISNVAADVVINEMLVSGFGFERKKVTWVDKNGCWLDTVFEDFKVPVEKDHSMEYYYMLLKKELVEKIKEALKSGKLKIVDSHEGLESTDPMEMGGLLDEILDGMNNKEKESLEKMLNSFGKQEVEECSQTAGTMPGNLTKIIKTGFVKKKKKWETVIKNWVNSCIKITDKNHEQWARINRRFAGICTSLFLPSEMEIEDKNEEKKKIKVVFFQDTSGSCEALAKRFFSAAKSLPTNRFDVDLYCFDTQVYPTTIRSGRLYGFGGTSFGILENYVNSNISKEDSTKYPKAVFVITDGFGDQIQPKFPKRWYWFLTSNYRSCIPKECNFFRLEDFE